MAGYQAEWDESSASGDPEPVRGDLADLDRAFRHAVHHAQDRGHSRLLDGEGRTIATVSWLQGSIIVTMAPGCPELLGPAVAVEADRLKIPVRLIHPPGTRLADTAEG